MENPFKNDFAGSSEGHKEYTETPRPNLEALEAKRDEYLLKDINDVLKKYDQNKISLIAQHIQDIESNDEANSLLQELISDIEDKLMKEHKVEILRLSPSGPFDREDKKIVDDYAELKATYPEEKITAFIKTVIEEGYL